MNTLLRAVLTAAEFNTVRANLRVRARRAAITIAGGIVAGLFVLWALIWLDAALWLYCAPRMGPAVAALIAAGAALLAALLVMLIVALARPRRLPAPAPAQHHPLSGLPPLPANPLPDLRPFIRRNKGAILIATMVAGLVLGGSPKRR